jgi:two-component system sensor histidine kinase UhpB
LVSVEEGLDEATWSATLQSSLIGHFARPVRKSLAIGVRPGVKFNGKKTNKECALRLMNYLVSWLAVVALLCLLGAVGWSLFDAHRSVEASASASADRIQHQLQALYWQKLLWYGGMSRETLVPQPEWQTLATLNVIAPGVCVSFAPPHAEAQRLCSQVEALGPVAPVWFATLDAWLFGQHRPIVRPLSAHDKDAGTVTTAPEPGAALRQSWHQVSIAARVAAAITAGIGILAALVFGYALQPVRAIVGKLRKLEQGDRNWRLPAFRATEFNHIARGVNDLADTLTRMDAARAAMTTKLFQVQEDERRALARDLHDEFGQCLTATLALAALIEVNAPEQQEVTQDARTITELQKRMMDTLRSTLVRLRAQHIEEIGLEASLRQLISDYNIQSGPSAVFRLHAAGCLAAIPQHVAINIYRIAQECLTNAVRHGSPTQVRLSVEHTNSVAGTIAFSVEDNGGGDAALLNRSPGNGILGIRERIAALGGSLFIGRTAAGVRIAAAIPVHASGDMGAAGAHP